MIRLALRTFVPLLLALSLMLFVVWDGQYDRVHVQGIHQQQLDAIEGLSQQLAMEHLWLEAYLGSGSSKNLEHFRVHRRSAEKELSDVLSSSHNNINQNMESHVRVDSLLSELQQEFAAWQAIAESRLAEAPQLPVTGSAATAETDASFDATFEHLIDLGEQIEARGRLQLDSHLHNLSQHNMWMFVLAALLVLLCIVYVLVFFRQQIKGMQRENMLLGRLDESEHKYRGLFNGSNSQRKKAEDELKASEACFRALVDQSPFSIQVLSPDGRTLQVNKAWEALWGVTPDILKDYNILEDQQLVGKGVMPYIKKGFAGEAAEIPPIQYNPQENPAVPGPFNDRWVRAFIYPVKDAAGGIQEVILMHEDVTEARRHEQFELEQRRVLEMITDSSIALSEVLHELVQVIEQQSPSMIGSILLLDDKGEHVLHGAAPHLPDEFSAAIDGAAIGPAAGSCGAAAYTGNTVIVSDIETDPLWADYKGLALSHGLKACWSQPIKDAEGKVLGTFAMYYREPRKPDEAELRLIENAAYLAGNAIIHKRMMDEIIQSEAALSEAQRIAHVGSWELDLVDDSLQWSDEVFRIFEIDQKKFGPSYEAFLDAIHPEDRDRVNDAYVLSLEMKEPYTVEHRLLFRDGRIKYINERCEAFYDEQGKPVRSVGTVQDITEKVEAEQQGKRLQQILEVTSDHVSMADFAGNVIYMNRAGRKMLAVGEDEDISSLKIPDFHPEKEAKRIKEEVLPTVEREGIWVGETKFLTRDGREILTSQLVQVHKSQAGDVEYYSTIVRDITEERQRLEKMEHVQRLESLGVLAGGIAHDFNNLLTAIMGHAALARQQAGPMASVHNSLLSIEETSKKAAELCQQMLAYSGKGKFVVQPLNLSELVREMTRLLHVSISKSVLLRDELAANLPAVEADVAQMQQVVMNLVINANEAIGERSGIIVIATGMIEADADYLQSVYVQDEELEPGHYVYLEVNDTGCGMNEETKMRLFEPFYTTKFTGRGLGMSAVLGIVRGHHGAIKVYSEEGKGTTFKVLFPAAAGEAVPLRSPEAEAEMSQGGSGTVLVVDDEETIREVASMILESAGYSTLQAVDGLDALEKLKEHREEIDCVLLDMTMPRMGGEEAFTEMRRIKPNIKVILSSGYNEQAATQRFSGKGLADFVQKPYTPDVLLAALAEVLKK